MALRQTQGERLLMLIGNWGACAASRVTGARILPEFFARGNINPDCSLAGAAPNNQWVVGADSSAQKRANKFAPTRQPRCRDGSLQSRLRHGLRLMDNPGLKWPRHINWPRQGGLGKMATFHNAEMVMGVKAQKTDDFETAVAEREQIVADMEAGKLSLEDS